jgi:hypothetical protein
VLLALSSHISIISSPPHHNNNKKIKNKQNKISGEVEIATLFAVP